MRVPDLHDDVITLRPFVRSDIDWLVDEIGTHRDISEWTRIPWPYERHHAEDFLARVPDGFAAGTDAAFAVVSQTDERLLGAVGLHRIGAPPRRRSAMLPDEVGYWLAPSARGQGHATRALRLVTDWAMDVLERPLTNLQTKVGNEASRRVAERAGYAYVGVVTAAEVDDDPSDHHRYVRRRT
jgi:RimJ/RimL family protein N-acetyltransferase